MKSFRTPFFFYIASALLASALFFLWFTGERGELSDIKKGVITVGTKALLVEIADTPSLRKLGLSGRESLLQDEGMLFVFEYPDRYGFWMREMRFSIDIVWIDETFTVRGVAEHLKPESFPKTFYPPSDILYALEVGAGRADLLGFKSGVRIRFEP